MMNIYRFEVTATYEDNRGKDTGLLAAESFEAAMKQISDYYGEDYIDDISLYWINEGCSLIFVPESYMNIAVDRNK